jgi:Protein-tyrosine-phosphatase-like, N-terminal domain
MLTEVVDRLSVEFAGQFSEEVVETVVEDVAARWKDAPVQAFVPVLTARFARDRLRRATRTSFP